MDNEKKRSQYASSVIDTFLSLKISVSEAGGSGFENIEILEEMTMLHFIAHVAAPNGIRFIKIQEEEE